MIFGRSEPQKCCSRLGETLIFTKSTFSKKLEKSTQFGVVLVGKIHEKSIENRDQKFVCFFYRHFSFFYDFRSILGSKIGVQIIGSPVHLFNLGARGVPRRPQVAPELQFGRYFGRFQ